SPLEVYTQPVDAGVATLLGRAALVPVSADRGAQVDSLLGPAVVGSRSPLLDEAASATYVLVRPEQVALARDGVAAEVLDAQLLGPVWRVVLRVGAVLLGA